MLPPVPCRLMQSVRRSFWSRSSAHVKDIRLEWIAHRRRGYTAAPHHPFLLKGIFGACRPTRRRVFASVVRAERPDIRSHWMMQQLLAQLHPNIQFPTITCPELHVPLGHPTPPYPPPPPNAGEDDASDVMK